MRRALPNRALRPTGSLPPVDVLAAMAMMDARKLYRWLLRPVVRTRGPLDPETLTGAVGFRAGGPVSLCTVGRRARTSFVAYVSCELATHREQVASSLGRYELLMTTTKSGVGIC